MRAHRPGDFVRVTMEHAMQVNQTLILELFGRPERVRILAVRRAGTVDVERLSDGKCFRVSGLAS